MKKNFVYILILVLLNIFIPKNAYSLPDNIELTYDVKFYPQIKEIINDKNLNQVIDGNGFYGQKEIYTNTKKFLKISILGNDKFNLYTIMDKEKKDCYFFKAFIDNFQEAGIKYKNVDKDTKLIDFAIENRYDYEMFENNDKLYSFFKSKKWKKIQNGSFLDYPCEVFEMERITTYPKTDILSGVKYVNKIKIWFSKKLNFPLKVEDISYNYENEVFIDSNVRIRELIKIEINKKFDKGYFDIKAPKIEEIAPKEYEKDLNTKIIDYNYEYKTN